VDLVLLTAVKFKSRFASHTFPYTLHKLSHYFLFLDSCILR
jgi:hypothetical protein